MNKQPTVAIRQTPRRGIDSIPGTCYQVVMGRWLTSPFRIKRAYLRMAGDPGDSDRILCKIERHFNSLAGLLESAIAQLSIDDTAIAALVRAKEAAEQGAAVVGRHLAG